MWRSNRGSDMRSLTIGAIKAIYIYSRLAQYDTGRCVLAERTGAPRICACLRGFYWRQAEVSKFERPTIYNFNIPGIIILLLRLYTTVKHPRSDSMYLVSLTLYFKTSKYFYMLLEAQDPLSSLTLSVPPIH